MHGLRNMIRGASSSDAYREDITDRMQLREECPPVIDAGGPDPFHSRDQPAPADIAKLLGAAKFVAAAPCCGEGLCGRATKKP